MIYYNKDFVDSISEEKLIFKGSSGEELNLLKKKEVTKTTRKLKYRIKKHTKGKTYYIRICGVNSKEVGKWSKIKK